MSDGEIFDEKMSMREIFDKKISNEEIILDHNSISHIHSFLTLNQSSEAGLISKDFQRESIKFLDIKSKQRKICRFYNIGVRNKVKLIDDKYSQKLEILQDIANTHEEFRLYPIRGSKYNLLKFNNNSSVINSSKYLLSFYKITNQKYDDNITIRYLNYDQIFKDITQISDNQYSLSIFINKWNDYGKTQDFKYKFKKDEKFYIVNIADKKFIDDIKVSVIFNTNIFIIYYLEKKVIEYNLIEDKKYSYIDFYILNSETFILKYDKYLLTTNMISKVELKDNHISFEGFNINCDDHRIKLIADFDSKYTIKRGK
jgi:hypothetical protein